MAGGGHQAADAIGGAGAADAVATSEYVERGGVRDVVGAGVLGADGCHAGVAGFAGFGECIVAGVKVFAFLLLVSGILEGS